MIDLDRYYLAVVVEAGFIYLGMQRFREAKRVFEGAKIIAPDNDIPIVALGNTEFCEGNFKKAIRHYDDALKVNADSLFAKVYKGEALFFNAQRDEAMELLREVKKDDPRGSAGGFAIALLDAIKDGFSPDAAKESHAKKKQKKSSR